MHILAHRGWWVKPEEKNSHLAFERAFEAGFGVETDLRDHNGEIVIAHDVPQGNDTLSFAAFLDLYVAKGMPGCLALNIKADGLQALTKQALSRAGVTSYFVFDMSVPDALAYLREGLRTFTRHSEYEAEASFYEDAAGVWVDCFKFDWITPQIIRSHLGADKKVALVSPELHGRPHEGVWHGWQGIKDDGLLLCTDFPDKAQAYFNESD